MSEGTVAALVCDATAETGLGHLSRCLALGEALAELGARPVVVGAIDPGFATLVDAVASEIGRHGVPPLGTSGALADRRAALDAIDAELVVVDSYALDADDLEALAAGRTGAVIDDFCRLARYRLDAIVNFTVAAPGLPYPPGPDLLAGPGALLVRRSLRTAKRTLSPPRPQVEQVLIAMGGNDAHASTEAVVATLQETRPDVRLDVVLGRPGVAADRVRALAGATTEVTLGAPTLAPHLVSADLVVCGGGLTKYEAAYLGRPVAVVDQSDDQAGETEAFAALGLAAPLGRAGAIDRARLAGGLGDLLDDAERREAIAAAARATFPEDPTGTVARHLLALA